MPDTAISPIDAKQNDHSGSPKPVRGSVVVRPFPRADRQMLGSPTAVSVARGNITPYDHALLE
jgi:hypothetical protein